MPVYHPLKIASSEITSEDTYINRRKFMTAAGVSALGAVLAACVPQSKPEKVSIPTDLKVGRSTDELNDPLTPFDVVTSYNNFYEFTTDKEGVARLSKNFKPLPWSIRVDGLAHKPKTFSIEDIMKLFTTEERIYRMRCVEGWSMVIPWNGFTLAQLLKKVEPMGSAKFVRFETVMRPEEMPGQKRGGFPFPYQEGLTIEEAMHELTILSTGLYGKELLNQNGAPLRLVVPWKYGFKSIKSIVRIELVEKEPETLWSSVAPHEYGFYANVNPRVPHPRWSQATERRIGTLERRPTLMFNGYEAEVGHLYAGMDLKMNY